MRLSKFLNNKGVTLIEMMVVVALIAVILIPISSFLINNYKIFNKAEDQVDAQRNANRVMELITSRAMESKGMSIESAESNIKVKFDMGGVNKWIISYNPTAKTISINDRIDTEALTQYAENIESFNAESVHAGQGVKLTIISKFKDESVSVQNQIMFRNR